jgi:WhiB family redox-sensing transcriptional regulator
MAESQRVRWIDVDWEQAKCIGHDEPDWFFNYEIYRTLRINRDVQEQRKFCDSCPILLDCLDYALRVDVHGFWGGTTREDRKIIRKQTGMQYEPLTFQDMSKGKVDNSGRELTKSS